MKKNNNKILGTFDPKTTKFPYPEVTDKHYLIIKKDNGKVVDDNYPYVDKSFWFRFQDAIERTLLFLIVFPLARIRLGLRIKNRKNLKKYKKVIKNGIISVSNHVHMWDYISIMHAIFPKKSYILAWEYNVRSENKWFVRHSGGIPIPSVSLKAYKAHMDAVRDLLNNGGWLHIAAEGSMWEYYKPVRPFKTGAAHYAIKFNKPVLPFGFSFREPGWIRKKFLNRLLY